MDAIRAKGKAFSLVELLIVIVIIGTLAGSVLLAMTPATDNAMAARLISEMRAMKSAAVLYYADRGGWPIWAYSYSTNGYRNLAPGGDGVLPDVYMDGVPSSEAYWIGVMYGPDDSGRIRAFVILYDQGLRAGVREILASKAHDMGFMAKSGMSHDFSDLHIYESFDDNLMWFITGY